MFIGHFALGMAAKRATPRVSLPVLFVAVQLADLLWPVLVAAGIETVRIDPGNTAFTPLDFISYPYSHSLLLLLVWATVFGIVYTRLAGRSRDGVVLGALVVSHWVLDVLTHRPDMPLFPGGPKVGLSLWNSVPGTLAVEVPLFIAGVWIYSQATRARDAIGRWALVGLVAFLGVAYVSAMLTVPPSVPAVYVSGLFGGVLLLPWSGLVDRHRESNAPHRSH